MSRTPDIVIDTNVIVAALRSRNGASFEETAQLTAAEPQRNGAAYRAPQAAAVAL
jgi:predicted nucleic acid-binding protein